MKEYSNYFFGLFTTLLILCCGACNKKKNLPPNILWITIEDTSPQFLGCYGNKNASTPTIDLLAKKGVRFTNAFSTGTVCSPSRTAIITGVKTYKSGAGHHRSTIHLPEYIKGFPAYLREAGYYTSNNKKTDYNVVDEESFIDEAWNESSETAGWWNRKSGQPFFSVFNFMDSHQSRTMTESYDWYEENVLKELGEEKIISDDAFSLPPIYNDTPEIRKQFARVYNSLKLTDTKIAVLLDRLKKDDLLNNTIIFFFSDHGEGMPRGKTNGIAYGYKVPMVIYVPEKYQELAPWSMGSVSDELIDFTDLAPTVVGLSGAKVPKHLEGRIVMGSSTQKRVSYLNLSSDRSDNGLDLVRTVTNGRYLYSRNFMPFMPELKYIRYMEIGEIKQQMRSDLQNGLLDSLQESLFEEREPEMLFDLDADPWETNNLAQNEDFTFVMDEMKLQLKNEILTSKDVLFLPEYELNRINQKTTPYQYRLHEVNYPLANIYEAASLSGVQSKDAAASQIQLLGNENKIIRYWAAMGLYAQESKIVQKDKEVILNAMQDSYPPVALIASALVYREFEDTSSTKKLKEFMLSENMDLALSAINFTLYLDKKGPFVETIKKVRQMQNRSYNVKAACTDFLGSLGLIPNTSEYRE